MKFVFGPTYQHAMRYCNENGLNYWKVTILDLNNPWYINEWRLDQRDKNERNEVLVLDNNYLEKPVLFQEIMAYLEEHADEFSMKVVEGVYFH